MMSILEKNAAFFMMHYTRLQKAIDFIEDNLDQPISLTDVSKSAFSSLSYFHRVFYFTTGVTVKEYIRKRRLSRAAYQLHCTTISVTAIAFQAGYETLETFIRAFKKQYGASPRVFRQTNQEQPLFARLNLAKENLMQTLSSFDFNLTMEYVLFKETIVQGFQIHTTIEGGQQAIDICHFANEIMQHKKLPQHFEMENTPVFGVYTNMSDENEFDYTIGCLANACIKPSKKLVSHIIPTSQYAKFTLDRTDRIKEAWHYIYGHWFLQQEQYRTMGFDFEIYYPQTVDIYIPMKITP